MTSVGMNLTSFAYYTAEDPFLDRMKSSGEWIATMWGSAIGTPVPLDANGFPTALPSGANILTTAVGLDPVTAGTTRRYVLTYEGTANFGGPGITIVDQQPGRIVFTSSNQIQQLGFSDLDPSNFLRNVHIVREDQAALMASGEIFNPAFLAKADDWSVLRFMDWGNTNGNPLTSWSDRPTLNSTSWANNGVPLEVMVALANRTHVDMWINTPAAADDDYVRRTMTYIRDNLAAGIKVHVEYSNEVWNGSFAQAHYAQDMANRLWGVDANHDGHVDGNDPNEAVANGNNIYYGYRAAQIAAIDRQVFGAQSDRVENVIATFTAVWQVSDLIFQGVTRANVGPVNQLFDDYAVTTYFGDALSGGSAAVNATILGWARGGSAGMDAAFREIQYGDLLGGAFALDKLPAIYATHKAIADRYGLDLVAYEGGLSAYAYGYDANVQGEIVDFFKRLENDPRMTELYTKMVTDFAAAGGSELTAYSDVGAASIWGTFGLIDSIYDTSDRYQGLAAFNAQTAAAAITTTLNAYTLSGSSVSLTFAGTGAFTGFGNGLDNVLVGGNGGNHLYGSAGNDSLTGGSAADVLDGGIGADRMTGGAGDDTYVVDDAGDIVTELANQGIDEVRTTLASYTLGSNIERLVAIGTGPFTGYGNELDNTITGVSGAANQLYGGADNDVLTGGAVGDYIDGGIGADRMVGGAGDDVYIVDNSGDVVVELGNQGVDEVRTALASYTLTANVENLKYTGSGAFNGTGNDLANVITGSATAANRLAGGGGADTLTGGTAADYLDGGYDADRMVGGAGNDVYIVDNAGDVVVELAGQGTDEVRTSLASYTLTANVENLVFTGTQNVTGTGNALANTITGGAGNDWLDGGAGADILIGGGGDDTYVVDSYADQLVESPGGGTDTVRTALSTYALGANVENLTYTGTGPATLIGNDAGNLLIGSSTGPNRMQGGGGNDVIYGGSAADLIDGGTGNDVLAGGGGNDVYIADSAGDSISELPGGGIDEVRAYSDSYTLAAEVENLTYMGRANFLGVGNGGANVIVGGAGNDQLYGNGGNDTLIGNDGDDAFMGGTGADLMIGGAGNDYYEVDDTGDRVVETVGQGIDTVSASISYTLTANVEQLVLAGSASIDGRGNDLANVIIGNGGDNKLYGFGGADRISGGSGNDTIDGGLGDDTIDGGDGNDRLIGGGGHDTLTGGAGADTFVFAPGDLVNNPALTDLINDFSHADGDKIDLTAFRSANLSFIGANAFTHHAGEVRMQFAYGQADVMFDLNGDGVADLHLLVTPRSGGLVASDFLL